MAAFPLSLIILYYSVVPTVNIALTAASMDIIPISMRLLDIIYFAYIIIGYYVYKERILCRLNVWLISVTLIASFLMCVIFPFYLNDTGISYKLGYDNIFLLITTICLFELLRRGEGHLRKQSRERDPQTHHIHIGNQPGIVPRAQSDTVFAVV